MVQIVKMARLRRSLIMIDLVTFYQNFETISGQLRGHLIGQNIRGRNCLMLHKLCNKNHEKPFS